MSAKALARALGGSRKSGAGWMARCPAHVDKTPSLKLDDGEASKVLVRCHANCDQSAVIEACKTRGLLAEEALS